MSVIRVRECCWRRRRAMTRAARSMQWQQRKGCVCPPWESKTALGQATDWPMLIPVCCKPQDKTRNKQQSTRYRGGVAVAAPSVSASARIDEGERMRERDKRGELVLAAVAPCDEPVCPQDLHTGANGCSNKNCLQGHLYHNQSIPIREIAISEPPAIEICPMFGIRMKASRPATEGAQRRMLKFRALALLTGTCWRSRPNQWSMA